MSFNSKKIGALLPREKRYVLTLDKGLTLRVHPSGKKQKQYAIDPVSGYTVNDAYRLWKNLKRGRIVSYKDEKSRIDRYNNTYGKSETIQPEAGYTLIIIKA